jgi:molybdopterin-guanine dinucleotide biosynthesis protein A
MAVSGIILAGGRSSRMGRDKASLVLDGETLLQRTARALSGAADELVLVRAPEQTLPNVDAGVPVVEAADPVEGQGPLVGIAAGLEAARAPVALIVAVDMPFLEPALLRLLAARVSGDHRWVVPLAEGRPQPLCSAIARDALPIVREHIAAGDRAPMAMARDLGALRLPEEEWSRADPGGHSFINVNTPEEFEAARAAAAEPPER